MVKEDLNLTSQGLKKSSEIDQIRISFSFSKGHKPIIKKTIKKRIPKLLFDDLLCIICNIPINLKLNITLISFK